MARKIDFPKPWEGTHFDEVTDVGLNAIQSQIMARLKSRSKGVAAVEAFPDRGVKYRNLNNRSVFLVRWDGSDYGQMRDVGLVVSERTLRWTIIIGAHSLGWSYGQKGEYGAYQLIELARRALMGFFTDGASRRLYPMTEVYREEQEGSVWWYECIYAHSVLATQEHEMPNFPLLTQVKFLEQADQTIKSAASAAFTFDLNNHVTLGQENVSGVIVENSDQSVTYKIKTDYTLDTVKGIVTRVPTGSIGDSATVQVSFAYAEVVTVIDSGGRAPMAPTN